MTTSLEGWINENENRALVYEYIPEIEKKNKMKILCFYWFTNTWFDQNKILLIWESLSSRMLTIDTNAQLCTSIRFLIN